MKRHDPAAPHVDALVAEARQALAAGDVGRAVLLLRQAAERAPYIAPLRVLLGSAEARAGDFGAAEANFRLALQSDPADAAAHANLGNMLKRKDDLDGAIAAYRAALDHDPRLIPVLYNLGIALREKGEFTEALACYDAALRADSSFVEAWYNRGNVLTALGDYDAAIASYDEALRRRSGYAEAQYSRSMALLLKGDFAAGWDAYEARWQARSFDTPERWTHLPRWTGDDLGGRSILVWGEQGVGDEIRFYSILGDLLLVAKSCVVAADPRLATLLERSFPNLVVCPKRVASDDPAVGGVDVQSPVASLARFRRRQLADFPPPRPFLRADPQRIADWRGWLSGLGMRPKIGISWRSGKPKGPKRVRYTDLDAWAPMLAAAQADYICLQYDDCAAELDAFAARHDNRIHLPPGLDRRDDFEGQAALYTALDLVISAPTTVADLTGGLGVPSWVVVHAPHWPWGIWPEAGPNGQPWYANLRMIDTRSRGGWEGAFRSLADELAAFVAAKNEKAGR
ncbi:MAG: tetratricopeptide repeat protein [Rhodospirillales bacterium]|nr:tetratricopeptide repeat protein [Rhodospirillales bacterium]